MIEQPLARSVTLTNHEAHTPLSRVDGTPRQFRRRTAADGRRRACSPIANLSGRAGSPNGDFTRQPRQSGAVLGRCDFGEVWRHTSGIGGNIFDPPAGGKRNDIRSLGDYLPLFVNEPLQFEPGTKNAYSNAGYVVLGLLIERLSGEAYYTYVRTHIFEPAGMTRTGSFAVDSLPPNTAIGYTRGDEDAPLSIPLRPNTLDLPGGYGLIVLANLDPPAAERVARMIRDWLGVKDDDGGGHHR